MSRGYRIRWGANDARWAERSQNVDACDRAEIELDLLNILPAGDMADLLRRQLEAAGWTPNDDGSVTTTVADVPVTLTPDGKVLVLELAERRHVTGRGRSQEEAQAALESASEQARGQAQKHVSHRLLRAEPELREQVNAVLQAVYLEALQKKAASLGDVTSIQENDLGDGRTEVVIKVKT